MDLSNQNIMSNYNYSFDRKHLLNLLKEKDLAIESLRRENENLISKLKEYQKDKGNKKGTQSRYWKKDEHERFLIALEKFGKKDVKSIAAFVGTRTPTQVRTHAQKWFLKQKRESEKKGEYDDSGSSVEEKESNSKRMKISESTEKRENENASHQNYIYPNIELQYLEAGINAFEYEQNDIRKIELIKKHYLPHRSVEEITQMISYYMYHQNTYNIDQKIYNMPSIYNQNSNTFSDKHSNISFHPNNNNAPIQTDFKMNNTSFNQAKYNIMYNMQHYTPNFIYFDSNIHPKNINVTGHVDTSEISYLSDNIIKEKEVNMNNFTQKSYESDMHDKEEEELVNELQSLSKRKDRTYGPNKTPNYSPIFPGSPIGIGSPFMGRNTPFFLSHGSNSPKYTH